MFRRTFKVTFKPMKNNFVLLPEHYFKLVSTYENGCLDLTFGNYSHFMTWVPYAGGLKDTEIGLNARVAKELGIKENELVKCTLIADVVTLKTVNVTPVSGKDWEIIELSSEKIQSTLLNQTRVINSSQILVVWVNKSMQVSLTVDRIKPNLQYGKIDHTTELIVAPNIQSSISNIKFSENSLSKSKTTASIPHNDSNLSRSTTVRNIPKIERSSSIVKVNRLDKLERLLKDLKRENSRTFEFRVISGKWDGGQLSDIFVTKTNLPEFMDLAQIFCLRASEDKEYYVNVKVIGDGDNFPNNIHPTIEINENLMKLLNINELEKITLRSKQIVLNFVEKIELFSMKKTHYKIVENSFKKYVLENSKLNPILLNQGQIVKLEDDMIVSVGITPEHFKYCLIDSQILKECKLYAADELRKVDEILNVSSKERKILTAKDLIKIEKFDEIADNMVERIKNDLCLDLRNSVHRQGNFIITGQPSTGKSVIVERILDRLTQRPYCCYYDIYQCTRNKGRKIESIQKDLRQIFTTCLNNAPSIVVLENLDILAHSVGEQQTQEGEYFNRIADTVQHLIAEYTSSNPIAVIATAIDVQTLNRRLYSPRGRHLFHTISKIPDLETPDRYTILKDLCGHIENEDSLDLEKFAKMSEGYNMGNLVQFVERAIFYAYRICKNRPILTNDLLRKSLENTNSYCLHGIECHKMDSENDESLVKVDEIAGMESVVTVLEEVLMWPSKYPSIFNDSPLRNQAGVLLYGPPGTGKTFLVSQISHSWNLRLISVKGPELLAKYIGQSEENVRNLFNRARSAKPCVLFFDEFDSLAPKRGHDSTGVTDRVVNQLLTELDGVEGLQGVTVIAATSRPELLDPALLRSGRIDRLVECTLPNKMARKKIFNSLSHTLHLDKSVDFNYLADSSENYTGADIQSVITTANMEAVKEVLKLSTQENIPDRIYISQKHLLNAFETTRPSLSLADIVRYQKTYARFTNKDKPSKEVVTQRATLA